MSVLAQVQAVARTEFRLGLRRGGPVITTLLIGLLVGAGIVVSVIGMFADNPQFLQIPPTMAASFSARGITVTDWLTWLRSMAADSTVEGLPLTWTLMLLTFLLLPLATVTSHPSDRKDDPGELLRAGPLTGIGYLTGKILGMLAVVLPLSALTLGIFFITLEAVFFHYFNQGIPANLVLFYLELTLLDGLPILIWGSAIGILAGIPFTRRRTAILPCFISGVLSVLFWGDLFSPLNPSHCSILLSLTSSSTTPRQPRLSKSSSSDPRSRSCSLRFRPSAPGRSSE